MRGKRVNVGKSLRVSCSSRRSRCQGRVTYVGDLLEEVKVKDEMGGIRCG